MDKSDPQSMPAQTSVRKADRGAVAEAARLLGEGRIVAVPTETVYGLAANAADERAVARIYTAKGRPDFNPLIVHVPGIAAAEGLVRMSDAARTLADAYWPGPLTLVLPKREEAAIAPAVTAGLPTLAIRCSAHETMQALLAETGFALAAPSANRSGRISPTEADHVAADLGARISLILDGGPSLRGIESTIVAMDEGGEGGGWRLLRPGPISRADIAAWLGPPMERAGGKIEAPGQLASHYAPQKPLRLDATEAESGEWLIGFGDIAGDENLSPVADTAEAAARLYAALHRADAAAPSRIAVAPISGPMADAINDRLSRAAVR